MGATLSLSTASLTAVPGGEASCQLAVRNTGHVVDQLSFEVLGDAAGWAAVEPPTLSLFPGTEGTVRIMFRPPRTADVAAGQVPFGVRVQSSEDPAWQATEEGSVEVTPWFEAGAELRPRTSRGRSGGRHEVIVDNRGNAPARVRLSAGDPDQLLAFSFDSEEVEVAPGTATVVPLRVVARSRFLRGTPQIRPFEVHAEPDGAVPVALHGNLLQDPVIPRTVPRALAAAALAAVVFAVLWATLLKPAVETTAKEAVQEEATPVTIGADGASSGGGGGGGGDEGDGGGGAEAPPPVTTAASAGSPIDGRLALTAPGETAFTVPDGKVLQLTDVVLQNPAGDTGRLQIRRDGNALIVVELANFRDLDYHFVAPIVFRSGEKLVLDAACTSAGCTPGAYFAGFLLDA